MALDWRKREYIAWLTTAQVDRDPPRAGDFAKKLEVSQQTLARWRQEADFLAEWERAYRVTVGNPGKIQEVMTELHATAIDRTDPRQVQAAKTYLEQVEGVRPKRVDVTVTQGKAAAALSDDELYAMIADRAAAELEARQGEPETT